MIQIGALLQGKQDTYRVDQILHTSPLLVTVRATVLATGTAVVLKELRLDKLHSWKVLDLFEREIRVLQQIDHPQLPHYLDSFQLEAEQETCLYLICSWAEGESLLEKLTAGWQPTAAEVWDIARQVLELLDYLHSFNPAIIHRDLKPGNLILNPQGQIQLIDLGSVQGVLNPDGGSTVIGTFGYMPPEQFSDQCVPASDLYALGATLVHLLTGKYPSDLPRKGMKLLYQEQVHCNPFYLQFLDKLLAPEIENRFQTAQEALTALEQGETFHFQSQQTSRIQTLARGTQLKISIALPGFYKCVGEPGLAGLSFIVVWVFVRLYFKIPGFWVLPDDREQMLFFLADFPHQLLTLTQFLYLNPFVPLLGLYMLISRLLLSHVATVIQLQPDRYQILHQLGRFQWKSAGACSEIQAFTPRFSFLRMTRSANLTERTQIQHLGPLFCSNSEAKEITGYIANYLESIQTQQAAHFIESSVRSEFGFWQKALGIAQQKFENFLLDPQKDFQIGFQSGDLRNPMILRFEVNPTTTPSRRIKVEEAESELQLVIGRKGLRLFWLTSFFISCLLGYCVLDMTNEFLETSVFHTRTLEVQFEMPDRSGSQDLARLEDWPARKGQISPYPLVEFPHRAKRPVHRYQEHQESPYEFLLNQFFQLLYSFFGQNIFGLFLFPLFLFYFCIYSMQHYLTGLIQTRLTLKADRIICQERILGLQTTTEVEYAQIIHLFSTSRWTGLNGDLKVYQKGGITNVLAHGLSLSDTRRFVVCLSDYLQTQQVNLTPLFQAGLANFKLSLGNPGSVPDPDEDAEQTTTKTFKRRIVFTSPTKLNIQSLSQAGYHKRIFEAGAAISAFGLTSACLYDNLFAFNYFYKFLNFFNPQPENLLLDFTLMNCLIVEFFCFFSLVLVLHCLFNILVQSSLEIKGDQVEILHTWIGLHWRQKLDLKSMAPATRKRRGLFTRRFEMTDNHKRRQIAAYCLGPADIEWLTSQLEALRQQRQSVEQLMNSHREGLIYPIKRPL